jgi:hypothetical protein
MVPCGKLYLRKFRSFVFVCIPSSIKNSHGIIKRSLRICEAISVTHSYVVDTRYTAGIGGQIQRPRYRWRHLIFVLWEMVTRAAYPISRYNEGLLNKTIVLFKNKLCKSLLTDYMIVITSIPFDGPSGACPFVRTWFRLAGALRYEAS